MILRKIVNRSSRLIWRCRSILRRFGRTEVLVLGDSHAEVFDSELLWKAFPRHYFNIVSVPGATASGLENPNSRTQAFPIYMRRVSRSTADYVVTMLGEVDTGFVIWHRAERHGQPVHAMLQTALSNYESLLVRLRNEGRSVICVSAPLPTIRDGVYWGAVANARRDVKANQRERTTLTLQFNREMQARCLRIGVDYVMLDEVSMGTDGLVSQGLLNSDKNNHHYDKRKHAQLVVRYLPAVIGSSFHNSR